VKIAQATDFPHSYILSLSMHTRAAIMSRSTAKMRAAMRGEMVSVVVKASGDGDTALVRVQVEERGCGVDGEAVADYEHEGEVVSGNWTPLTMASFKGKLGVVEFLVKQGADKDLGRSATGSPPLHVAALQGHQEVTEFLVKAGAQIDKGNNEGVTALHGAAHYGHSGIVQYLVGAGAQIDKGSNEGGTALYFAANSGHLEIARYLARHGWPVDATTEKGNTALKLATQNEHTKVAQFLELWPAILRRYTIVA
jgi:hypothetical protein